MSSEMEKKRPSSRRDQAPGKLSKGSGKQSIPAADDLSGKNLGKFAVVKKIGSGGMGAVYLAKDSTLDRTVALKILPAEKAESPTLVKRFRAEAKAAAMLDHDNIVGVFDSGEIDGLNYISMEYIDGIDVSDLIKRKGTVGVKRSIDIVRQIALALQHANERNIVHRDIKPSNFMITRDGIVKLADMGLARAIDEATETSITRAGSTVGTIDYMAPEQARSSKAADTRSDIYSLGCAWFHMLAGHPPFNEGSVTNKLQAHAVAPVPDLRKINDHVPMGVIAIITRMMAKRQDERYQTPDELLEDLANENILRTDIAEEGLDALAREVVEEKAKKPAKVPTLPPKEKKLVKVDNASGGFLEAILNFVPVLIVAGISIGVIALMWWGIRGIGDAMSGGSEVNLAKIEEEKANNELLNKEGSSLVENANSKRVGDPLTSAKNSTNSPTPNSLQENSPAFRGSAIAGNGPAADSHPAKSLIETSWNDTERLAARRLASKKNLEPVDNDFAAQLSATENTDAAIELTDNGPYVLTKSFVVKSPRLILRAARGLQPVIMFSPDSKTDPKEEISLLSFNGGHHLIEGIEFVTILGEVGHERPTNFLRVSEGTKLDILNSAFSQEGSSQTGTDITAIHLLGGVMSPTVRAFQCLFRGEDLSAVNLNSDIANIELTRCVALTGQTPVLRVTDPKEDANSVIGTETQRSLTIKESLFATGASILSFDASNRTTTSPITKLLAEQSRFISLPSSRGLPTEQRAWLVGHKLASTPSASGAANLEQYLQLELSRLQFAGFEQMLNTQDQQGKREAIATIGDLESKWKARWLELTLSPTPAESPAFREVASKTSEAFDLTLAAMPTGTSGLPAIKSADYRFLTRPSFEKQMVLQSTVHREDVDRLFEGAETFRVEIPKQRLQDFLHNDRLPPRAIIEVRGTGEIELPAMLFEDKLLRIDFGKPGDIVLRPLDIKSTVAQRAEDKLPYESLFTIRNGIIDLRGATIVLPATKILSSPIWAVTSDRGHILLDRCHIAGPLATDSLHAGLIRQISRSEPPIGKLIPELVSAATIITNSTLLSSKTIYESDFLQPRMKIHNTGLVTMANALSLSGKSSPTTTAAVRPRIEISRSTISSGQTAISVTGSTAASSRPVPLVIQDCVFAPRLDLKSDSSNTPLFNLDDSAKAYSFWWFNNGITSSRPNLTTQVTQTGTTPPTNWDTLWKPGHDVNTLFGADGILMARPMPEPKDYNVSDLALSPTCKANSWSTTNGPIGVDIKVLDDTFKAGTSSPLKNLREGSQSGNKIRPDF